VMTPNMAAYLMYVSPDLAIRSVSSNFEWLPTRRHSFPTHVTLLKRDYSGRFHMCNVEHGLGVSHNNTFSVWWWYIYVYKLATHTSGTPGITTLRGLSANY
jgi:hypothetical protein